MQLLMQKGRPMVALRIMGNCTHPCSLPLKTLLEDTYI